MSWFRGANKPLKCPVMVTDKKTGKTKKCGRKCASPAELMRHSERAHGGTAREI